MLSSGLLQARFAVVDLETTGASAVYDRITEVAAVVVEDGRIATVFESLVDPGVPIPAFITRLTGIDNRMVAGKPRLEAVLPRLHEALEGRVFVAHNASFDYAFLKQGYARTGARLQVERLCTLRLARRLVPGLRSYRLEALLERFEISPGARHRARSDAEATGALLLELLELAERAGLRDLPSLLDMQQRPIAGRRQRGVDEGVLQALSDGPGVYLLKDAEGQVLYVGKSRHVRTRVREHLRGDCPNQPRLRKRLSRIVDVEAIETGSELEALFLESKLIKRYLPEANVVGRGWRSYAFLKIDLAEPFPRLEVTREPPEGGAALFGPLRRVGPVTEAIDVLQESLGLRRCPDEIRPGMSACPLLDLKKCLGPCVRPAAHAAYGRAVGQALDLLEGRDTTLLEQLARRRDELAEALRFEEAAALRDHIRELERLLGDQRRLEAVARRNLVVVAPSRAPDCRELFFIRAGRLVDQQRVELPGRADRLRRLLKTRFSVLPPPGPIEREVVDEMRHLEDWLRRERKLLRCVPVDPDVAESAAPALLAAVRADRRFSQDDAPQQARLPRPARDEAFTQQRG